MLITAIGLGVLPYAYPMGFMAATIALLALGMGIGNPSMTALASLNAGEHEQGLVLGITQSFGSLARVFSPALATFLYNEVNHQIPFLSAAAFALIAFLLAGGLPKKDSLSKE